MAPQAPCKTPSPAALNPDSLNRILYADLKTSLPDDLLAMTDRMSMAASIECRATTSGLRTR